MGEFDTLLYVVYGLASLVILLGGAYKLIKTRFWGYAIPAAAGAFSTMIVLSSLAIYPDGSLNPARLWILVGLVAYVFVSGMYRRSQKAA